MEDKRILRYKMWYKIFSVIFLNLIILVIICTYAKAGEFGPFQGKILDADTKEPIEGVVVLIEWYELHFFAGATFYDAQEILTNKNGEFYIPGILVFNPVVRLRAEAGTIIYKSGYYGIHVPWKALLKPWGEPIVGTKKTYVLEVKDEKPIIMLKKITDPDERWDSVNRANPGSHLPDEKKMLLMEEINREKEVLRKIKP